MTETTTYLGRLGNPAGVNVARVEVSWYDEDTDTSGFGYWLVHATGEEPEVTEDPDGTIYTVFETLVYQSMQAKIEAGRWTHWDIEDISAA